MTITKYTVILKYRNIVKNITNKNHNNDNDDYNSDSENSNENHIDNICIQNISYVVRQDANLRWHPSKRIRYLKKIRSMPTTTTVLMCLV